MERTKEKENERGRPEREKASRGVERGEGRVGGGLVSIRKQ